MKTNDKKQQRKNREQQALTQVIEILDPEIFRPVLAMTLSFTGETSDCFIAVQVREEVLQENTLIRPSMEMFDNKQDFTRALGRWYEVRRGYQRKMLTEARERLEEHNIKSKLDVDTLMVSVSAVLNGRRPGSLSNLQQEALLRVLLDAQGNGYDFAIRQSVVERVKGDTLAIELALEELHKLGVIDIHETVMVNGEKEELVNQITVDAQELRDLYGFGERNPRRVQERAKEFLEIQFKNL